MDLAPPQSLLVGRRNLDGRPGITLLGDFEPDSDSNRWHLKIRLTINRESVDVPRETEWYLRADATYPRGDIDLWPSRINSLEVTFPHQNANLAPTGSEPWRSGRICVDVAGVHLGGDRLVGQPEGAGERLLWHCNRARLWLCAAASSTLVEDGDAFEAPQYFVAADKPRVYYDEDEGTFGRWSTALGCHGELELIVDDAENFFVGTTSLALEQGVEPRWGLAITDNKHRRVAFWLAFPGLLVVGPHGAPHTWGQLRSAAKSVGVDLDRRLKSIVRAARHLDGDRVLLVGQPISKVVGKPPVEMMFYAMRLPELTQGSVRGFRNTEESRWRRDLNRAFGPNHRIDWMQTENVSESHLSVRGKLPQTLRDAHTLLLGCGALGSAVADLLVRMGVRRITLVDHDVFKIHNARRHVLTLDAVGMPKATALAQHLNRTTPFAEVKSLVSAYPSSDIDSALKIASVVIDCTAEDEILSLGPSDGVRWCFSFSLGAGASSMFSYGALETWFSYEDYRTALSPLLTESVEALKANPEIRFVGCSNPVFPSPWNRVVTHAGVAVEFVSEVMATDGARKIQTTGPIYPRTQSTPIH